MVSRRRRGAEQGYVLVLAMLVLVVLSGIGAYSMRSTRIDLRATGNSRLGAQAEYVAEAALQQSLAQVTQNPSLAVSLIQAGGGTYSFPVAAGLFGENAETYDALGAGTPLKPSWNVVMTRAIDVSPSILPGYMVGSVGGTTARFRIKRIDVTSTGRVAPATGAEADQRTATAQVRAHVMVGPL